MNVIDRIIQALRNRKPTISSTRNAIRDDLDAAQDEIFKSRRLGKTRIYAKKAGDGDGQKD